jgi:hypothetical protein
LITRTVFHKNTSPFLLGTHLNYAMQKKLGLNKVSKYPFDLF